MCVVYFLEAYSKKKKNEKEKERKRDKEKNNYKKAKARTAWLSQIRFLGVLLAGGRMPRIRSQPESSLMEHSLALPGIRLMGASSSVKRYIVLQI